MLNVGAKLKMPLKTEEFYDNCSYLYLWSYNIEIIFGGKKKCTGGGCIRSSQRIPLPCHCQILQNKVNGALLQKNFDPKHRNFFESQEQSKS